MGLLQSKVQIHVQTDDQGSQAAKDKSDAYVTNIPMTGSLKGAHYNSLDKDDSEVDFDTAAGQVMKFKNAQGYKNVNDPDVFVGDTEDGTATVDMVKGQGKDIFASIVNTVTNTITQIGPDADDNLVVTETSTNDYPEDAPSQETGDGPDDLLLLEQGAIQVRDHEGADDGSILDVLVVWTHYAECAKSKLPKGCTHTARTEANIKGTINLAIQETNTAFDRSKVLTDLRLVHMYRDTEGFDEAAGYSDALRKITNTNDGVMDSVHAEREKYKADIVVLIIQNRQYCGMAWLGPSKSRMFSVTGWSCATGYYSFGHEIMHNLGCNHDHGTTNACSKTASNYGYRDPAGQFRSIMGYNCRTGQCDQIAKSGCPRVQRVSNPDITYLGKPIGTKTANNAKRINDVRKIVAQYYDSAVPTTKAPTTQAPTTAAPTTAPSTSKPPATSLFDRIDSDNSGIISIEEFKKALSSGIISISATTPSTPAPTPAPTQAPTTEAPTTAATPAPKACADATTVWNCIKPCHGLQGTVEERRACKALCPPLCTTAAPTPVPTTEAPTTAAPTTAPSTSKRPATALFDRIDSDNSGIISLEEFKKALSSGIISTSATTPTTTPAPTPAPQIFDRIDKDNNNAVSKGEFEKAIAAGTITTPR